MTRRARRNPTTAAVPRVAVRDALVAWPARGPAFARVAGLAALSEAGFLDDPATQRALRAQTFAAWTRVLTRCGTPLCLAVSAAGRGDTVGARAWLVEVAPHMIGAYQQALFAAWDAERDAREMLPLLFAADHRTGVWATCQVARVALPYVPAGNPYPQLAIERAEAWTRGEARAAEVRAGAAQAAESATGPYAFAVYAAVNAAYSAAGRTPLATTHDLDAVAAAASTASALVGSITGASHRAARAELANVVRASAPCPELQP